VVEVRRRYKSSQTLEPSVSLETADAVMAEARAKLARLDERVAQRRCRFGLRFRPVLSTSIRIPSESQCVQPKAEKWMAGVTIVKINKGVMTTI